MGPTAARRLAAALGLVTADGPDETMALVEDLLGDRSLWSQVHESLRAAAEATGEVPDPVSTLTDLLSGSGRTAGGTGPDPSDADQLEWLYDARGAVALERSAGTLAAA